MLSLSYNILGDVAETKEKERECKTTAFPLFFSPSTTQSSKESISILCPLLSCLINIIFESLLSPVGVPSLFV